MNVNKQQGGCGRVPSPSNAPRCTCRWHRTFFDIHSAAPCNIWMPTCALATRAGIGHEGQERFSSYVIWALILRVSLCWERIIMAKDLDEMDVDIKDQPLIIHSLFYVVINIFWPWLGCSRNIPWLPGPVKYGTIRGFGKFLVGSDTKRYLKQDPSVQGRLAKTLSLLTHAKVSRSFWGGSNCVTWKARNGSGSHLPPTVGHASTPFVLAWREPSSTISSHAPPDEPDDAGLHFHLDQLWI
jgi:hypothetical protein